MNKQTFLTGEAIYLVILEKEDAPILQHWINNPEITQYLSRGIQPMTLEAEEAFIEGLYKNTAKLVLGIYHKKDQKLIGNVGLHEIDETNRTATFGIMIGESDYHGNGIGTEVLTVLLKYAFNTRNLRSVKLSVLQNNPRGKRCYEKCGFREVGRWPKHVFKNGEWHDEILMICEHENHV